MAANLQGFYPAIGRTSETSSLTDVLDLAGLTVATATSNVTNFQSLTNMAGAGKILISQAGIVYAIPVLVNA